MKLDYDGITVWRAEWRRASADEPRGRLALTLTALARHSSRWPPGVCAISFTVNLVFHNCTCVTICFTLTFSRPAASLRFSPVAILIYFFSPLFQPGTHLSHSSCFKTPTPIPSNALSVHPHQRDHERPTVWRLNVKVTVGSGHSQPDFNYLSGSSHETNLLKWKEKKQTIYNQHT